MLFPRSHYKIPMSLPTTPSRTSTPMIGDTDMNLSNSLGGEPEGEGLQEGSPLRRTSCQVNTGYHTPETEPLVLLMRVTLPGEDH